MTDQQIGRDDGRSHIDGAEQCHNDHTPEGQSSAQCREKVLHNCLPVIALCFGNGVGIEFITDAPHRQHVEGVCWVVFAFFFVTVASRIVGLVGVTSNPTSGMTIAALLGTSMIFLAMGWTDMIGKATALTVGCVVAIAASIDARASRARFGCARFGFGPGVAGTGAGAARA